LPAPNDQRVLIDYRTSDDAGVYRLDGDRALVQTVDFFTPIVDDPFVYGQIAAANALSDVYAMGGRPLTALAIAAFPAEADLALLKAIFAGGLSKLREAETALLGGHTVRDSEVKFGYAITGEVNLSGVWSNAGAKPGDALLLTKAIGTGIISTALKFERAPQAAVDAAITSMITLNRGASEALSRLPAGIVHGCTDVTGFGLIGHAAQMAAASGVTLELEAASVPLLEGVGDLVEGNVPGGGRTNMQHFSTGTRIATGVDPRLVHLLYDPQTSGGLLVTVHPRHAEDAARSLRAVGVPVVRIGQATPPAGLHVVVL
jgi:selenide,water dikinase